MSMTTDEALEKLGDAIGHAFNDLLEVDGWAKRGKKAEQRRVEYRQALSVLREALAGRDALEVDTLEKMAEIYRMTIVKLGDERDALKAEVERLKELHEKSARANCSASHKIVELKTRVERAEAALKTALALQNPPPAPIVGDEERRKMLDYLQGLYAGAHPGEELVDENIPVSEGGLLNCKFVWCAGDYKKLRALILAAAPAKPKAAIDELSIAKTERPNWHKVSFLISTERPVEWIYSALGVPKP